MLNLDFLDIKTKMYMIMNRENFMLPIRIAIDSQKNKWETSASEDVIFNLKTESSKERLDINEVTNSLCNNYSEKYLANILSSFRYNVISSKEDIREFFYSIISFYNSLSSKQLVSESDKDNYRRSLNLIIFKILPWKLKAYSISKEIENKDNTIAEPINYDIINNETIVINELFLDNDIRLTAINIKLLHDTLNIHYSYLKKNKDTIINILKLLYPNSKNNYDDINIDKIINNNILDMLDEIPITINPKSKIIKVKEIKNKGNYPNITNHAVCMPNDKFYSDKSFDDISSRALRTTINEINIYISTDHDKYFTLSESDLGYLIDELNYGILKILFRDGTFRTVANIDDELYLLFKIGPTNTIGALGLYNTEDGKRKFKLIETDTTKIWKLSM